MSGESRAHPGERSFEDGARSLGVEIAGHLRFPDHYPYPPQIVRRLINEALAADAMLVTTEKDAMRIPRGYRHEFMIVQVRLEPEDWGPIDAIIDRLVADGA